MSLFAQWSSSPQYCCTEPIFKSPILICVWLTWTSVFLPSSAISKQFHPTEHPLSRKPSMSSGQTFLATFDCFWMTGHGRLTIMAHLRFLEPHALSLLTFTWTLNGHFYLWHFWGFGHIQTGFWSFTFLVCVYTPRWAWHRSMYVSVYLQSLLLQPQGVDGWASLEGELQYSPPAMEQAFNKYMAIWLVFRIIFERC